MGDGLADHGARTLGIASYYGGRLGGVNEMADA
jgi:hypothetical protein